jgi:hypothetical protein
MASAACGQTEAPSTSTKHPANSASPQANESSMTPVEAAALAEESARRKPPELNGTGTRGPFNPRYFVEGWELQGATIWARRGWAPSSERGWDLSFTRSSQSVRHWLSLSGTSGPALRYFGDKNASFSLSRHRIVGGLALGPTEILGGFGFSTITIDRIASQWGIGLLAPMCTMSIAVRAGRLRVETGGYIEYLWRWNARDYVVRGISLSLRLQD